jgi:hypothetical protein
MKVPSGVIGVERLRWFGRSWQLRHSDWSMMRWTCWLVVVGLVGWCRRLGSLRPRRWWGGPKWMSDGFGFDQRFGWSLHLDGDVG